MKSECHPISILPHLRRLFLDYCERHEPITPFFSATPFNDSWMKTAPATDAARRNRLADLLAAQNTQPAALANIESIRRGANAVVTGQQVALFGGPLFTPFKAATVIQKAQQATAAGYPTVPIFWLATEDHDFAEINHTTFPAGRALATLRYTAGHHADVPVGGIEFGPEIGPLVDQAAALLGPGPLLDLLQECYQPGRTFGAAFGKMLSTLFASHGLIIIDASSRGFHALGAEVLRQAIVGAGELRDALIDRDALIASRGYHSQVLVTPQSSLLFLIDAKSGARQPLKFNAEGKWQAARNVYSTDELLGILDAEPERLSPNALLRPVFQDAILPTAAYIGGPAEIAYFAQSQVLFERILGRTTPILPRLTATLIEPAIAEAMARHELTLDVVLSNSPEALTQRLAARAIPIEGKRKLASAGNALDEELIELTNWMQSLDAGLGKSANVSASKMRYQMNRLRRLAANFQLQKEASLRRHAEAVSRAILPDGHLQERYIGAAYFFSKYGDALVRQLVEQAIQPCPGHKAIYL